jgi:hypothetical protein
LGKQLVEMHGGSAPRLEEISGSTADDIVKIIGSGNV